MLIVKSKMIGNEIVSRISGTLEEVAAVILFKNGMICAGDARYTVQEFLKQLQGRSDKGAHISIVCRECAK